MFPGELCLICGCHNVHAIVQKRSLKATGEDWAGNRSLWTLRHAECLSSLECGCFCPVTHFVFIWYFSVVITLGKCRLRNCLSIYRADSSQDKNGPDWNYINTIFSAAFLVHKECFGLLSKMLAARELSSKKNVLIYWNHQLKILHLYHLEYQTYSPTLWSLYHSVAKTISN